MPAPRGALMIGQSGGPTAVINASLVGAVEAARQHDCITGVYGMRHGIEGVLKEDLVDLGGQSAQTLAGLKQTPSAALGSCRRKLSDADYQRILAVLEAHGVRYFCYIGGNDSADTSYRVGKLAAESGYELYAVGIPKTVDNDLGFTDHCPGYGSVARFNAMATRDAGRDTEAIGIVDNVKIIETMGRNAGWITASTVLGKETETDPPHVVLLPEVAFRPEPFLAAVKHTFERLGYCLVTVCEGLRGEDGREVVASQRALDTDQFGHRQLGGVADFLVDLVASNLGIKARFDKPGTIQRMFMLAASPVDVEEAYLVGATAVHQAVAGVTGQMVTLVRESNHPYRCTTGLAPLQEVANAERPLPPEFIGPDGMSLTAQYLEYARPLIGGPLPPYARLEPLKVPPCT